MEDNIILTYRGKNATKEDINFINALVANNPSASRYALSKELCKAWNWVQANGNLRDMVARGFMLKLHSLIEHQHYLGYCHPLGEQLKYMVYAQDRPIACFSWSSAPRHIGARDRYIGWNKEDRAQRLQYIAYNSRFLILPWVKVPHLASHLLGLMAKNISRDWEKISNHPLYFLETFVDTERFSGIFTSGIISKIDEGKRIAIFYTGRNHAGENIASLYEMRAKEKDPPIQMCDALSRNMSSEFIIILCHCLTHSRRSFVDVIASFQDECRYVIETLAEVYHMDAKTKEQNMTPDQRLAFHQVHSSSKMNALRSWLDTQFKDKLVEPNSGLGKAITYMIKHWKELTQFLIVPGAPLDNNICEQGLKRCIRHRKNSLFYRTEHGAYIGDMFMSLIHTCNLMNITYRRDTLFPVACRVYSQKNHIIPACGMPPHPLIFGHTAQALTQMDHSNLAWCLIVIVLPPVN